MTIPRTETAAAAAVREQHDPASAIRYGQVAVQGALTSWNPHAALCRQRVRMHGKSPSDGDRVRLWRIAVLTAGGSLERFDRTRLLEMEDRVELI